MSAGENGYVEGIGTLAELKPPFVFPPGLKHPQCRWLCDSEERAFRWALAEIAAMHVGVIQGAQLFQQTQTILASEGGTKQFWAQLSELIEPAALSMGVLRRLQPLGLLQ